MGVFRIEHMQGGQTTMLIAAPLVDMTTSRGTITVLEEIALRVRNLIVDNQLPLSHCTFDDHAIQWYAASQGNDSVEHNVRKVLDTLRSNDLSSDYCDQLHDMLQTLPINAYRFGFLTDIRFVNRGLDMIHAGLFATLMELFARRTQTQSLISDMCGEL